MTELSIVSLEKDALDELCALELICFPNDPWSRTSIQDALSSESVSAFGAKLDGKLVAYSFASHVQEVGEIQNIAVLPDKRNLGIGKKLLGYTLDRLFALGCEDIFLEVRMSNAAAIALYGKFGFDTLGVRKGYYSSPREDALIMSLSRSAR